MAAAARLLAIVGLVALAVAAPGCKKLFASPQERFHLALEESDFEAAEAALAKGASVEGTTDGYFGHEAALLRAIDENRSQVVSWLLDKGASVEVQGDNGDRPIHRAIKLGDLEIVRLLLAKGPDVKSESAANGRPLPYALRFTRESLIDMAGLLLAAGADPNAPDAGRSGEVPLEQALLEWRAGQVREVHVDGLELLVGARRDARIDGVVAASRQDRRHGEARTRRAR